MILLSETSYIARTNEVILLGGTHDGKHLILQSDVCEVRLPVMPSGVREGCMEITHESYHRVYTNIFAIAGMDDEAAIQRLVQGYRSKGAVEFGVVEVEATTEGAPHLNPSSLSPNSSTVSSRLNP